MNADNNLALLRFVSRFLPLALICVGLALGTGPVAAQTTAAKTKAPASPFRVRVKQNGAYFVTIRARDMPLTQVAAEAFAPA